MSARAGMPPPRVGMPTRDPGRPREPGPPPRGAGGGAPRGAGPPVRGPMPSPAPPPRMAHSAPLGAPPAPGTGPVPLPGAAPGTGGPGGPSQPYGPYPPAPSRRGPDRRQLALIAGVIVAAVIAVIVIVSLPKNDGSGGTGPATVTTSSAGATPSPRAPGIGDTVTDQGLAFTVTDLDCSQSQLGEGILALRANGRFCLAKVTVSNTGGTEASLDNAAQLLLDSRGDKHESSLLARLKLGEDLWETIEPGETRRGTLVFDVAKDAQPRVLELHASPQSPGARLTIR